MKTTITRAVLKKRPGLEDQLWTIACYCKQQDPDIKLMGLYVRVTKGKKTGHWHGWAHPEEESTLYGKKVIHPAGRIDLSIGENVTMPSIVKLFAHELRHIGQFHRGRKLNGFLTADHMDERKIEPDCHAFEHDILTRYKRHRRSNYGED